MHYCTDTPKKAATEMGLGPDNPPPDVREPESALVVNAIKRGKSNKPDQESARDTWPNKH
jgi:hypothetical protein